MLTLRNHHNIEESKANVKKREKRKAISGHGELLCKSMFIIHVHVERCCCSEGMKF